MTGTVTITVRDGRSRQAAVAFVLTSTVVSGVVGLALGWAGRGVPPGCDDCRCGRRCTRVLGDDCLEGAHTIFEVA